MNAADRSTRQRLRRLTWGGLAVACALLLAYSFTGQRAALDDELDAAQARSVTYTTTVLYRTLDDQLVSGPILGQNYPLVLVEVQAEIMTDPRVVRVRIWSDDGLLLFSTGEREEIGKVRNGENAGIRAAVGGETTSVKVIDEVAAKQGLQGEEAQLFETFVPLRVPGRTSIVGAVEIDQRYAAIVEATAQPWTGMKIGSGIGFVACLLLTLIYMRRVPAVGVPEPQAAPASPTTSDASVASPAQAREVESAEVVGAKQGPKVKELQDQLMQEQLRRANAERAAREAEHSAQAIANQKVQALEMELRAAQGRLQQVGSDVPAPPRPSDLESLRAELDGVRAEMDRARFQQEAARVETEHAREEAARAASRVSDLESRFAVAPMPPATAAEIHPDELGAEEAEAEVENDDAPVDPMAAELRAKLARTAARKRPTHHEEASD